MVGQLQCRNCFLCGSHIVATDQISRREKLSSWASQYRTLCARQGLVSVTGVGCRSIRDEEVSRNLWSVPREYVSHWSKPIPGPESMIAFKSSYGYHGDGKHDEYRDWYGFIVHEVCWLLLEKSFSPGEVPLKALYWMCRSMPRSFYDIKSEGVIWNHGYGGLIDSLFKEFSQRYLKAICKINANQRARTMEWADATEWADPLRSREISRRLSEQPRSPETHFIIHQCVEREKDGFTSLSEDIRLEIAKILPTADALKLRLASRLFLFLFDSQSFWASRFTILGNRSWLFEALERKREEPVDWRWLYCRMQRSSGLRHRARIWMLIEMIKDMIPLTCSELFTQCSSSPLKQSLEAPWVAVTGRLIRHRGGIKLYADCFQWAEKEASVPKALKKIQVYFTTIGHLKFLAGIKLIPQEGEDIYLGHETTATDTLPLTQELYGFVSAVKPQGIQGIQCVFIDGSFSRWLGTHLGAPLTWRLVTGKPLGRIAVRFDACKLVSLAVRPENESSLERLEHLAHTSILGGLALWYPEIPNRRLSISNRNLKASDICSKYEPFLWTHFGGPKGVFLPLLIGVTLSFPWRLDPWRLEGMKFHYNLEGSYGEISWLSESVDGSCFPIDGPGGELIVKVDEVYLGYTRDSAPHGFKLTTNRGRVGIFIKGVSEVLGEEWDEHHSADLFMKPIIFDPATTITGFYTTERCDDLGVISEFCQPPEQHDAWKQHWGRGDLY